jgi:hypothetical protein
VERGLEGGSYICLLARRRANSGYRSHFCARFLKINSGVRDAAADDSVEFGGAQFAHRQSPDIPGELIPRRDLLV